ncbi:PucR family transcriptional regulator [Nocardia rhizosphaerae]|uniref:PucR family transcriptional regulator n=1 Tax=Nocardia rhizosphaerae TaxID=1691571 RepID=A0ABV8LA65_9NOCA
MTVQLESPVPTHPLREIHQVGPRSIARPTDDAAPAATSPGTVAETATRICAAIVRDAIDGADPGDQLARLATRAASWAHDGVPVDTILHAVHTGVHRALDAAGARSDTLLLDGFRTAMATSDLLCTTVSRAYIGEHRAVVSEHHTSVGSLASALLAGTAGADADSGIPIAEAYSVLALWIGQHPDEHDSAMNGAVVARRKLRRVQACLAKRGGDRILALLSVDGGTLLVPAELGADSDLDGLVEALARAARADITAAVVGARTADIPTAAEQAHELLDMVERLGSAPGLYRFADLALEYQLTRPGPGRAELGALLRPLDDHPELYDTLRVHIANNMNRQRTAHVLHIHTNTVDYRIRRVAQLTGLDPTQCSGLWHLRSAMIAHSFGRRPQRRAAGVRTR